MWWGNGFGFPMFKVKANVKGEEIEASGFTIKRVQRVRKSGRSGHVRDLSSFRPRRKDEEEDSKIDLDMVDWDWFDDDDD